MINRVNKKRERVEFFQGDLVLVSVANWPLPQDLTPKFNHRYDGPYKYNKTDQRLLQITITYNLQNPRCFSCQPTFKAFSYR